MKSKWGLANGVRLDFQEKFGTKSLVIFCRQLSDNDVV